MKTKRCGNNSSNCVLLLKVRRASPSVPANLWRPSRVTMWALGLSTLVVIVIAFLAGYLPLHSRTLLIADEAHQREQSLPQVGVITVRPSSRDNALQLPGNIQAITEAPVLARADGYLKQRLVDIGDRVHAGQTLGIIEAPELDEQVRQAQAESSTGPRRSGPGGGQSSARPIRFRTITRHR